MTPRVAVLGLGSIGARHLANLQALGVDAIAVRRTPGPDALGSADEALAWGATALVVATPTAAHAEALRWAVEHGVHAYVEKPIAASSAGLDQVLADAERRGVVVATGYNLRFHPALEAARDAIRGGEIGRLLTVRAEVGHYLPDWHPEEDYRGGYAARSELGGGALLTLSHELDHVRWIGGEIARVRGLARTVSLLDLDVDDVAELVCEHVDGVVSSVHADLFDRAYNRRARWVGETGSLSWSWGGPLLRHPGETPIWEDPRYDPAESYRAALRDFVDAIEGGRAPRCDGRDGLRVVELCEQVDRSIRGRVAG